MWLQMWLRRASGSVAGVSGAWGAVARGWVGGEGHAGGSAGGGEGERRAVFLLMEMETRSSRCSTRAPLVPVGAMLTRQRWLSVPPETMVWPREISPLVRANEFLSTCFWCSTNSGVCACFSGGSGKVQGRFREDELRRLRLLERGGEGADRVVVGAALVAREHGIVDRPVEVVPAVVGGRRRGRGAFAGVAWRASAAPSVGGAGAAVQVQRCRCSGAAVQVQRCRCSGAGAAASLKRCHGGLAHIFFLTHDT